jgi:hypothetical protein
VFGSLRFTLLYRRWLKHGDAVFEGGLLTAIADALAAGTGRVEQRKHGGDELRAFEVTKLSKRNVATQVIAAVRKATWAGEWTLPSDLD